MKTRPLSRAGKVLVPLMFYDMSLIKLTIFEIHKRVKCVNRIPTIPRLKNFVSII